MGEAGVSSEAIDRSKVKLAELVTNDNRVVASIEIRQGQNFFYRRRVKLMPHGKQICHVLGRLSNGVVDGPVVFHFDEGIVVSNEFDAAHPWFYPVDFVPCELQ